MRTVLGDTKMELKCRDRADRDQELIDRPGAKPMSSLGGACPCLMCSLLLRLSDHLYSVRLRIEGHGTLKASHARRVALRLRDIGLLRSAKVLETRFGRRRGRGLGLPSRSQLDLPMPGESSSASGGVNVDKFSTPKESLVGAVLGPLGTIITLASPVGDK